MSRMRELRGILHARAEKLSVPLQEAAPFQEELEILSFQLSQEEYGIETKYIREVYPIKEVTRLPHTPAFVYGLINLRRKILAVMDLRALFSLKEEEGPKKAIILQHADKEFAIVADAVKGIERIAKKEVEIELPTLTGIKEAFLLGVTASSMTILDGAKLLASKQLVVNDASAELER